MLVNICQTTQHIPEDSHFHACCCKNLKSHQILFSSVQSTFLWFILISASLYILVFHMISFQEVCIYTKTLQIFTCERSDDILGLGSSTAELGSWCTSVRKKAVIAYTHR
jgi:hypothetical protein